MKLFLSALEPSSNLHAKEVIAALLRPESNPKGTESSPKLDSSRQDFADFNTPEKSRAPQTLQTSQALQKSQKSGESSAPMSISANSLELIGVFDRELLGEFEALGVRLSPTFSPREFSIMGFSDVARALPFLLRAQRILATLAPQADRILLMDSSSFHIRLAKRIKRAAPHAKIHYYILPQLWAWKPWRAKELERYCDRLLGILPFEASCYSQHARDSRQFVYVGHPLLDELDVSLLDSRAKALETHQENHQEKHQQQCEEKCIVFMPGSRRSEIRRIFPVFVQVARALPNAKKLLVIPKAYQPSERESIITESSATGSATLDSLAPESLATLRGLYELSPQTQGALGEFELCFDTSAALARADFGFICSGTATLEAALLGVPFVLAYRTGWLDFMIARAFVRLRVIGLANIFYQALCGERAGQGESLMHAELIQEQMSVENLLEAYARADERACVEYAYKLRGFLRHPSAHNVARILLENDTGLLDVRCDVCLG